VVRHFRGASELPVGWEGAGLGGEAGGRGEGGIGWPHSVLMRFGVGSICPRRARPRLGPLPALRLGRAHFGDFELGHIWDGTFIGGVDSHASEG